MQSAELVLKVALHEARMELEETVSIGARRRDGRRASRPRG